MNNVFGPVLILRRQEDRRLTMLAGNDAIADDWTAGECASRTEGPGELDAIRKAEDSRQEPDCAVGAGLWSRNCHEVDAEEGMCSTWLVRENFADLW